MPDLAAPEESSVQTPLDALVARAGAKDRTHIQRHLAACDAEPDPAHGALWRRLAGTLSSLAPLPVQTAGHTAVLFFVPDGKYRMQVFSLEDSGEGRLAIYMPDILAEALRKKLLKKTGDAGEYAISARATLHVEALDSQNTPEPAAHIKNMLGWNRKALRVTLPLVTADGPKVEAAEALCELAAKQWGTPPARPAAPPTGRTAPRAPRSEGPKKRTA